MEQIFLEITIIIVLASVLSILFRFLKQPAILAYIVTGILLGPLGLFRLENGEALQSFGSLGIILLLFMLGLELKVKDLKSIGKPALIAGFLQMYFTFMAGFFVTYTIGLSIVQSVFVGLALSFSSTIVIVKMLSDKKDLNSLYGKLVIGILLIQDLFAILSIIVITGIKPDTTPITIAFQIGLLVIKGLLLVAGVLLLSRSVFPRILHIVGRSQESLFLFSLAWVFLLTAFVSSPYIGFSAEIGGFLAGIALANAHESFQIIAKMKVLRDFFITIFFVMLGLKMPLTNIQTVLLPGTLLALFVLLLKPAIMMCITGVLGYKKRTSFLVGTSLSQVSEFSLILLFLGNSLGYIQSPVITLIVLVSLIAFLGSSLIMQNANALYKKVQHLLSIFEGKVFREEHEEVDPKTLEALEDHVIIIGGEHMGETILQALEKHEEQILLVDFNPDVIKKVSDGKITALFGDIVDTEIQERSRLHKAKLVISTATDFEDNLLLLQALKYLNKKAKAVVVAVNGHEAKMLYKAGAHYVVLPHLAGGHHLAKIINEKMLDKIEHLKEKELAHIS